MYLIKTDEQGERLHIVSFVAPDTGKQVTSVVKSSLEGSQTLMNENEIEDYMANLLDAQSEIKHTETFAEAEVLTMNKGLVVIMQDGTEIHITLQKTG